MYALYSYVVQLYTPLNTIRYSHQSYGVYFSEGRGVSAQMRAEAEGAAAQIAQLEEQVQGLRRQLVESRQQEGE